MDEAHFSYKFNKVYHIRPIDYLIRLRLRKAADLLLKGYSVTEAAWNVGYQDPLYFSRLYKKHFGIPQVIPIKMKEGILHIKDNRKRTNLRYGKHCGYLCLFLILIRILQS